MTQTYRVRGMSCNGCKTAVTQKLNALDEVISATVDLASETAQLVLKHPITQTKLQSALPAKFTISEILKETAIVKEPVMPSSANAKIKQLKPLLLIFTCILLMVMTKHHSAWNWQELMLDFMGTFFLLFSLFKFFDLNGFANAFAMYDPIAKRVPAYGKGYPFIEVILGMLFLSRLFLPIALVVTIVMLGITTIGVIQAVFGKKQIQCACLGTVLKLPMTEATLIENGLMIIMAILMIIKLGVL